MNEDHAHCPSCAGAAGGMSRADAMAQLATLPAWELSVDAKSIVCRKSFKNFATALAYTNTIGALAEEANHHPDFTLGWGYVTLTLTTHDAGGLTPSDFIMAAKINDAA